MRSPRFGDFEDFPLEESCTGVLVCFRTRHPAMVEVVEYARRGQITVSVCADSRDREWPVRAVYRELPAVCEQAPGLARCD